MSPRAALWGSLLSCGRLAIGLLGPAKSRGCQPPRRMPSCPTSTQLQTKSVVRFCLANTDNRLVHRLIFLSFASLTTLKKIASALPLVLLAQKESLTALL